MAMIWNLLYRIDRNIHSCIKILIMKQKLIDKFTNFQEPEQRRNLNIENKPSINWTRRSGLILGLPNNAKTNYLWVKTIVYCLYPVFLTFCSSPNNQNNAGNQSIDRITINIDDESQSQALFPVNKVFKNPKYIQLETNSQCVIAVIDKIIVHNNHFYILDRKGKQILVFDNDGKYIQKVGAIGKGPGEYISLDDFCIEDSTIFLLARAQKRVLLYNIDGSFSDNIRLNDYSSNIETNRNQLYLFRNFSQNTKNCNIVLYDINRKKRIAQFHEFKESQSGQGYESTTFAKNEDDVFCFFPNDYTIYKIKNDLCIPQFFIDFGKHALPEGSQYKNYKEMESISNLNTINRINDLQFINGNILFNFTCGIFKYSAVYSSITKILAFGYIGANENFPLIAGNFVGQYGNKVIDVIEVRQISTIERYGSPEIKTSLTKLKFAKKPELTDNPILLLMEFKDEK